MELFLQPKKVTIWGTARIMAVLFALLRPAAGQQANSFYNLDKEIKIEGVIREVRLEPRYGSSSPFLVLLLDEKGSSQKYKIDISPAGFFELDFHKGEQVKIVGAVCGMESDCCNVIAREVRCRGNTLTVRDKHGFPSWRKGTGPMMSHRMGKGGS